MIERLEEDFDRTNVHDLLSLLASARRGLSETELLELLENHGDKTRSISDLFPILRQIRAYLQHRGDLLYFFHYNFFKAARAKYLESHPGLADGTTELQAEDVTPLRSLREESVANEVTISSHTRLADYFSAQPNYTQGDIPNIRRCDELPWQLLQAGHSQRLVDLLVTLEFLEAKVSSGLIFELADNFADTLSLLPAEHPEQKLLVLLYEALRRDIYFIARHAKDYPQALFQCLWNSCWWYDCQEAAAHYVEAEGPWSHSGSRACLLLEKWRAEKQRQTTSLTWLRSLRPPAQQLGSAREGSLEGHRDEIMCMAWSPDGMRIASASKDRKIRIWDARSNQEVSMLEPGHSWTEGLAWFPDSQAIAAATGRNWLGRIDYEDQWGASDCTVQVWDAVSGERIRELRGHSMPLTSVACFSDGRRIVSGSEDKTVRIWDAGTGEQLHCLEGHKYDITCVACCPDGTRVVSGSRDNTLCIWDSEAGHLVSRLVGHKDMVLAVAWSQDGELIASGGGSYASSNKDYAIHIWDVATGKEIHLLEGHGHRVNCLAFSGNRRVLASGSDDATVRLWDAATGLQVRLFGGSHGGVLSIATAPDGKRLATTGVGASVNRLWNLETDREPNTLVGTDSQVRECAWSADGRQLMTMDAAGVAVWAIDSGRLKRTFSTYNTCFACSPDGRHVAAAFYSGFGGDGYSLGVWDVDSGAPRWQRGIGKGQASRLAWSPDGSLVVVRWLGDGLDFWDVAAGELLKCFGLESRYAFAPNGRSVAICEQDKLVLHVYETANRGLLHSLKGNGHKIIAIAFSADSARIAVAGEDGVVMIWDAQNGHQLHHLTGHKELVSQVIFSPDSRQLATWGYDKKICLWDVETGEETACLNGHTSTTNGRINYSPDSRVLVSCSDDRTVRVWDPHTGNCLNVHEVEGDHPFQPRSVGSQISQSPYWALGDETETVVWDAQKNRRLAWYPTPFGGTDSEEVSLSPAGKMWACFGSDNAAGLKHSFHMFALEGSLPVAWGPSPSALPQTENPEEQLRMAIRLALADHVITNEEGTELQTLRKSLNISRETASRIFAEVRAKIEG